VLSSYFDYYHGSRTYLSLGKDSPEPRPIEAPDRGRVITLPQVGGLHHRYQTGRPTRLVISKIAFADGAAGTAGSGHGGFGIFGADSVMLGSYQRSAFLTCLSDSRLS
jgi:hypothetical protein